MQLARNASGEMVFGAGAHQLTARQLLARFGSPLFVYDEATLRARARAIRSLSSVPAFRVYYSAKVHERASDSACARNSQSTIISVIKYANRAIFRQIRT